MPRPTLPARLSRGDRVIVSARRRMEAATEYVVVACGPKWLRVVLPQHVGTDWEISQARAFLLEDQGEGRKSSRVGYSAYFATREQHEYDLRLAQAARVVTDCGLDIRRDSVFAGDDGLFRLASILRRAIVEESSP